MPHPQENRPHSHGVRGVGAVLVLMLLLVLAAAHMQTVTVRAAQAADGQELFTEMMPVFTSPRCLGCHGLVDPSSGGNHEGGKVDVEKDFDGDMAKGTKEEKACLECHTAANQWRTAPGVLSFVGKDPSALCVQIKRLNGLGGNSAAQGKFLTHLSTDYFVGLAFVGKGAIGDDSPFAPITPEPPGMSRPEFVAAGKRWIQEGRASCGSVWNGKITMKTTFEKPDPISQGGTVRTISTRSSEVTITVVDGVATAEADYHSNLEIDDPRWKGGGDASPSCHYQQNVEGAHTNAPVPASVLISVLQGRGSFVFNVPSKMDGGNFTVNRNFPKCNDDVKTERDYLQAIPGGYADGPVDPKNPTEMTGMKPINESDGSKTIIEWNLKLTKN